MVSVSGTAAVVLWERCTAVLKLPGIFKVSPFCRDGFTQAFWIPGLHFKDT